MKQGGASKEDIELLPKYKFHQTGSEQKVTDATPGPCEGVMTECETNSPIVRRLTADDAVSPTILICYFDSSHWAILLDLYFELLKAL